MKKSKAAENTPESRNMLFPAVLITISAVFPTLCLYTQNTSVIPFVYSLPFFAAYLVLGWCAFFVLNLLLKSYDRAAVMTAVAMTLFLNFGAFGYLFPTIHGEDHTIYFLCIGICALVFILLYLLIVKLDGEIVNIVCMVFAVVFGFLTLYNIAGGVIRYCHSMNSASADISVQSQSVGKTDYRPNFYYFIFDEYAGPEELESCYHFDNSYFYDYLSDKGFSTATSATNYMTESLHCLADLSNISYLHLPENTNEELMRDKIIDGEFFSVTEQLGYHCYEASTDDLTELDCLVPEVYCGSAPTTEDGKSVIHLFVYNTAAYFLTWRLESVFFDSMERPEATQTIMDHFTYEQIDGDSNCYFVYICCPHVPFSFRADGSRNDDPEQKYDWSDPELYLGQLQYINTLIFGAVDNILAQDPESIIVLMSDHGAREHDAGIVKDGLETNILLSVYYCGQDSSDLLAESGVNTLRRICNRAYGTDFDMLDYEEIN